MSIELLQQLLPVSRRGVRWVEMDTEIFLDVTEDAVAKAGKDPHYSKISRLIQVEGIVRCLRFYTEALPDSALVFIPLPADAPAGTKPAIDVDATLAGLPASAWHKTGELELRTSGPTNLLKIFSKPPDFQKLASLIGAQSGASYPLDATPRALSVDS